MAILQRARQNRAADGYLARLKLTGVGGDPAVNVPTYNGGLFRTKFEKETSDDRDARIAEAKALAVGATVKDLDEAA